MEDIRGIELEDCGIRKKDTKKGGNFTDDTFKEETTILRHRLKQYFYTAVTYQDHRCSVNAVRFICMLLQIVKVILITSQVLSFGDDRSEFNSIARLGHRTLRHLLLKDWDASWETLPYPPAHGEFAVYDTEALKDSIDYAVTKLYNIREDAIGFFDHSVAQNITAEVTYFNFSGFEGANVTNGLNIKTTILILEADQVTDPSTNETRYIFDTRKFLERYNMTKPLQRVLSIQIGFNMRSVRVDVTTGKARCLSVDGKVVAIDTHNNGQIKLDLQTLTKRRKCVVLGYNVEDVELKGANIPLSVTVLLFVFASLLYTVASVAYGIFLLKETKVYMKRHYKYFYQPEDEHETDLSRREYMRFLKGWDIIDLGANLTTISGTLGVGFQLKDQQWTVGSLETYAIILGIGCIFAWTGLMRYLKINYKFNLLFNTIYASLGDVLAYLICTALLFTGYVCFGYAVIGPYHVKFQTIRSTAATLFSLINGDEIYATFALFQDYLTGGPLVPVFYQIYLGSYIAIFTVIVINLLIALFTNAYETVKKQFETCEDKRDGPMEIAFKQVLTCTETEQNGLFQALKSTIVNIMGNPNNNRLSFVENKLRSELRKTFRISPTSAIIIQKKPKTLQAFITADDIEVEDRDETVYETCCCRISCLGFRI